MIPATVLQQATQRARRGAGEALARVPSWESSSQDANAPEPVCTARQRRGATLRGRLLPTFLFLFCLAHTFGNTTGNIFPNYFFSLCSRGSSRGLTRSLGNHTWTRRRPLGPLSAQRQRITSKEQIQEPLVFGGAEHKPGWKLIHRSDDGKLQLEKDGNIRPRRPENSRPTPARPPQGSQCATPRGPEPRGDSNSSGKRGRQRRKELASPGNTSP